MTCNYGKLEKSLVDKIVDTYQTPLYIFHSEEFIDNYNRLLNCFRAIYPKYNIAYSYKTNYTPRICRLVKELGGYAEVVSHMEFWLARQLGYDCEHIIYNGPVKGDGIFEQLANGGVINVDSIDEMNIICEFAQMNPDIICNLAFRLNIDIEQEFISRFGIDAFNGDLDKVFAIAKEYSNIKVVGLHCHVGRSRGIQAWENRLNIMFSLVDKYFVEPPKFIDLGSGMNSDMEPVLAEQFGGHIPTFEEYAEVVAGAFSKRYSALPEEKQPLFFTEPGTTLISGNMTFIAKVKSIKFVRGKYYVTFDCSGGNMGDICHLKQLPITVFNYGKDIKKVKNADFVGYTCLEHDVIYKGFTGTIAVGDVLQFRNIGSYSNVFKPPFILPNCAMIELDANRNISLIKRAETFEDIFNTYVY